jgi:hypothetical protein
MYQHMTLERVVSYESFITCWAAEFLHFFVFTNHHLIRNIDFKRIRLFRRLRHENTALLTVVAFVFQVSNQACAI